jgi:IS4 transposase
MLSDLFTAFIQASSVTVMIRSLLERMLNPAQLDAWFEQTAEQQYTRELLFSSVFGLMLEVVCGVRRTMNRAYAAHSEAIPVSLTSVYNKLNGIETQTSAELVRYSAAEAERLVDELGAGRASLLPDHRVRMLDGNCLAGTEHRLKALRGERAAALPGKSLAVYEPASGLVTDVFPCEDGHAQERSLLGDVLERVRMEEVWVADRNFCTLGFLGGLARQQAYFVIREHQKLAWKPLEAMCPGGETETGKLSEQAIEVVDAQGHQWRWRRIRVDLKQPTRDGDHCLHILTNLPLGLADACRVAELYRRRWTIETAFQHLEQNLNSEINTLGYPKAALFGFCTALVAYNVMAVVMAALRQTHGQTRIDEAFSSHAMAEEISATYRGMMIAIPAPQWHCFQTLPIAEFCQHLLAMAMAMAMAMAKAIRLAAFHKKKRSPKKQAAKGGYDKLKPHLSTAKVLAAAKISSP